MSTSPSDLQPSALPPSLAERHLVVLGLMGVGKSTTATALASALDRPCFDSDEDIQELFGQTGGAIAWAVGVDALHDIESAMLLGRLASSTPSVISAAAWIVEEPRCCDLLRDRATVVVLDAPLDEIARRALTGGHRRTMDRAELDALAARRRPMFDAVVDIAADATQPTDAIVATITAELSHKPV